MPIGPDSAQLHLTITKAEKRWLTEQSARHDDAPEGWYAVVLLRYGIRHAKKAWSEMTGRAQEGFADSDDSP